MKFSASTLVAATLLGLLMSTGRIEAQCVRSSALSFDGVDDVVIVGSSTPANVHDFDLSDTFSIGAWIRTTFSGGYQPIVSKWGDTNPTSTLTGGWRMGLVGGSLYFNHRTPSTLPPLAANSSIPLGLNDGQWHHVVIRRGSPVGLCDAEVIVDGQVVDVINICSSPAPTLHTPSPLTIGGELPNAATGAAAISFNGEIDDVRILGAQNPNLLLGQRFTDLSGSEPGLVGYWRLDDGAASSSQTAVDLSPSMADGTLGATGAVDSADPAWTTTTAPVVSSGGGQANGASARLEINGAGTGAAAGPFPAAAVGGAFTFSWSGDPNQPFALFGGPINAAHVVIPFAGSLDLGVPAACITNEFSDIFEIFTGFALPGAFFYNTDAAGNASQSFQLPPGLPVNEVLLGVQGMMGTATGIGLELTAAFHLISG